jgi:ribosomal-protein-alanine N-acetyltransferase
LWKTETRRNDAQKDQVRNFSLLHSLVAVCTRYNGRVPRTVKAFQVRDFRPSDFETLWSIDQDCFPPGISYSRTELRTYMRRAGSFTLVAESAGEGMNTRRAIRRSNDSPEHNGRETAGFIVAESHHRAIGHIITIDVIPAARRHGVGSLLLDAAEERLRSGGCLAVELETAVDNASALSFYKRHSYQIVRTFPRYYANGVDALVLEKDLGIV